VVDVVVFVVLVVTLVDEATVDAMGQLRK